MSGDPLGYLAALSGATPNPQDAAANQQFGNQFPGTPDQAQPGSPALAPPPSRQGGRLKQMLSGFVQGMGESMMHQAGIPTDYERQQQQIKNQQAQQELTAKTALQQAQAQATQAESQTTTFTMPDGTQVPILAKHAGQMGAAVTRSQAMQNAAQIKNLPAMLKSGYRVNPDTGQPEVIPENEQSPQMRQGLAAQRAFEELQQAKADVTQAQNDPDSPIFKQKQAILAQKQANFNATLGLREKSLALQASKVDTKAIDTHDKAYVKPANDVEKSYQMMDSAYQEYKAARAQGKELPTGAQSMLALSSHLSTTFGNVKGARITKDMIEHHLGARGISDRALVATQKLTNGDVLSPDQWEAFHSLIGESRKLSWGTAVKEADRKKIPIDFLPRDLQGMAGGGGKPAAAGKTSTDDPLGIR